MVVQSTNLSARWTEDDLLRLRPMLAQAIAAPFDSDEHLFELKWDGVRYLCFRLERETRLINRKGAEGTRQYPELIAALSALPVGTVLDGEVVAMENGVPSLPRLMTRDQVRSEARIRELVRRVPVAYIAFDVLFAAGESLLEQPLHVRKQRLHELLTGLERPPIVEAEFILHHGKKVFGEAVRLGFEGIIAKRLASRYRPGQRTDDWLKLKPVKIGLFQIIGFISEVESRRISALVIGERMANQLVLRGKVGTGFTETQRCDLYEQLVHQPVLHGPPPGGPREAHWRETPLQCEVRYFELTKDGRLRAPVCQRIV